MKYSMFIGRWQTWHSGHEWLVNQRLDKGKNVLICIRDVEPDENNPHTAQEIYDNLSEKLGPQISSGQIKLIIIPDVESVNYGRGVGYEIIEHVPPQRIEKISGTKIRKVLDV
jgi:nicotinamide mononucleotide adenylyltransferase